MTKQGKNMTNASIIIIIIIIIITLIKRRLAQNVHLR